MKFALLAYALICEYNFGVQNVSALTRNDIIPYVFLRYVDIRMIWELLILLVAAGVTRVCFYDKDEEQLV